MSTKQKRLAVLSVFLLIAVALALCSSNWSDWRARRERERQYRDEAIARAREWESEADYKPLTSEEALAIYYAHLKRLGVRSEFSAAEIEELGTPHVDKRTKHWPFRLVEIDGPIGISIDEQSHRIHFYLDLALRDQKDKEHDPKKAARLSNEEATRLAWQLWGRVRESNDRKGVRLEQIYYVRELGFWRAVIRQTYGEYDTCFSESVQFFEDGQLYSLRDLLPPIRCSPETRVGLKDARRKARKAVDVLRKTHRYFKGFDVDGEIFFDEETRKHKKTGKVRRVVAPVMKWRDPKEYAGSLDWQGPQTFRLAYEFTYRLSRSMGSDGMLEHDAKIFIDTINGDCVAVQY